MVDVASGSDEIMADGSDYSDSADVVALCRRIEQHLPGYEIHSLIAAGGQGMLFLGRQVSTDRHVAIKIIPPTCDGQASGRALREAKVLAKVAHPNIVSILACGEVRGYVYLVMEHILGESIDRMMEIIRPSVSELVAIYVKICRAIAFAHGKGIIHRDLKPNNVLLSAEDNEPRVLDFGLARNVDGNQSPPGTRCGAVGTFPYMSPEQVATGGRDIDFRSDIYSLGVLFYYVLSATFPYGVEDPDAVTADMIRDTLPRPLRNAASIGYDTPPEERRRVADDVEKIVFKALEKDPARRYQTADEMAEDFERFLRGEAVHAKAMSRLYVFRKFLKRHRVAATIGLVLTASSIGVATAAVQSASAGKEAAAAKQEAEAARRGTEAARAAAKESEREADATKRALEIANAALRMIDLNAEGNKLRSEGELSKAAEAFEKALLVAGDVASDDSEIRRREFGALYGLAEMYFIENQPERAAPYCVQAIELAARMCAGHQGDSRDSEVWQGNLAYACMLKGWAAAAQDRWDEAVRAYGQAERIRRAALADDPNDVRSRRRLAITMSRVGTCEQKLGHQGAALVAFRESRDLHLLNAETRPSAEAHIISVANSEICLANWHIAQESDTHFREAEEWLDQAEERLGKIKRLVADRDRNLQAIANSRRILREHTGSS